MSSFLGKNTLSRGIRNNNPGNLRFTNIAWQGKIPKEKNTDAKVSFEQFTEVKWGIRAMLRDLLNDIDKGKNTLRLLINEYAPPIENNTANYINVVAKSLGMTADEKIVNVDALFLLKIGRAIISHENGKDGKLILDSDIDDAINILGDINLKGVTVSAKKRNFKYNYMIVPVLLFFYSVFMITL